MEVERCHPGFNSECSWLFLTRGENTSWDRLRAEPGRLLQGGRAQDNICTGCRGLAALLETKLKGMCGGREQTETINRWKGAAHPAF